ncbi:MAG: CCA tRNA nucleotidyltransferase [Candidatus Omnitrophica bacterium]|nr:CCA tRNA nucleotidyltransferase [Candidatus Omnitrophota bacterium]
MNLTTIQIKINKVFPKELIVLIKKMGIEGDSQGVRVFLVGGIVRDLLLGRKNYDLDIVVEGNATKFGKNLAEKIGGTLVSYKRFKTATLFIEWPKELRDISVQNDKFKIDIAAARKEIYKKPAGLPVVSFSSIRKDLCRRDFTINSMAVCINKDGFGSFIDHMGGEKDLKDGVIRVLHDKSFIDDPTRILRAVRFEQRFGFSIEKRTKYLIKHAIRSGIFSKVGNQRVREEIILMLKENFPEKALCRMRELHELRFVHPKLTLQRTIKSNFISLRQCIKWYNSTVYGQGKPDVWVCNLMFFLDKLSLDECNEVLEKFVFPKEIKKKICQYKIKGVGMLKGISSGKKVKPSGVYRLFADSSVEAILCLMAKTRSRSAKIKIRKYLVEYRTVKLEVSGSDIVKSGLNPGPKYKEILRDILDKKIDGELCTKKDELRYLNKKMACFGSGK